MHTSIKTWVGTTLSGTYTKVSSTQLSTVSALALAVPDSSDAVTMPSGYVEPTALGPTTTPTFRTYSTLQLSVVDTVLTVTSIHKVELNAALANGEVIEMFTSILQTSIDYYCFYTKLAFDGLNHTTTNAAYYKQKVAPLSTDFTANKPFDNTTGFSSGYVLVYKQPGASTAKGTAEL